MMPSTAPGPPIDTAAVAVHAYKLRATRGTARSASSAPDHDRRPSIDHETLAAIKVMEQEYGSYLFKAFDQHGVLQLTFTRRTISRPFLIQLAKRRAPNGSKAEAV